MHVTVNLHHYHPNEHNAAREHNVIVFDYPTRAYDNGRLVFDNDDDDSLIDDFLSEFFDKYPRALDRIVRRVHHAAGVASVVHDAANDITYPLNDAITRPIDFDLSRFYVAGHDIRDDDIDDDAEPASDAPDPPSDALTVEKLRGQINNLSHRLHMVERVVLNQPGLIA